ncbi:hypothetical protein MSPP1_001086 [Malassezia sp. CBS 17886]|nr:hypothetical protein MSPP1_001086 [Malassezia sp. CBS 17886]
MPPRRERDADDTTPALTAREKRSLTYESQIPPFLRTLHAQLGVGGGRERQWHPVGGADGDTAADAVEGREERKDEGEGEDEDDLAHAQVVVLNEGKHLTRDEYLAQKNTHDDSADKGGHTDGACEHGRQLTWTERIAGPAVRGRGAPSRRGAAAPASERGASVALQGAKDLVRKGRDADSSEGPKKQKAARHAKKARVSLSFDMDND